MIAAEMVKSSAAGVSTVVTTRVLPTNDKEPGPLIVMPGELLVRALRAIVVIPAVFAAPDKASVLPAAIFTAAELVTPACSVSAVVPPIVSTFPIGDPIVPVVPPSFSVVTVAV